MAEKYRTVLSEQEISDIVTKEELKEKLLEMGIQRGMLLLVEANTENLGYMVGGVQTFLEALMECVGYDGTIVMPAFTFYHLDPACSGSEKIIRESWELLRDQARPFHRKLSAPSTKDEMIHQFLRNDGVLRSYHPIYSFAAWGKYAKLICDKHPLHFGLSQDSPLGKLTELNGYVLLAGCDYSQCTMFHLARYEDARLPIKIISAPIEQNTSMVWKDMLDLDLDEQGFDIIGEAMEERKLVKHMYVNDGYCRFFSAREAVKIANAYYHIQ